jgi:hypothetical protein
MGPEPDPDPEPEPEPLSDVAGAVGAVGVLSEAVGLAVVLMLGAGSADSATPVMERKEPSFSSVIARDQIAWGRDAVGAC